MKNNKNGFTLIELLVVVLIIGILAAVALPQYQKAVTKARIIKYFTYLKTIGEAHEAYCMANNTFAPDIRDLDIDLSGISEYKQASYTTNTIISAYFPDGSDCGPTYDHSAGCIVRKNGNSEFWIYKKGDTFQCGGFTQKASDVCKSISDGNAPKTWSASSNGLYTVKF